MFSVLGLGVVVMLVCFAASFSCDIAAYSFFFLFFSDFFGAFFALPCVSFRSVTLRCITDGWVYTNDAWLGSRPAPYISGGGSVTRRRRWVRRVWYDPRRASVDG